jgi:hypothetical protein
MAESPIPSEKSISAFATATANFAGIANELLKQQKKNLEDDNAGEIPPKVKSSLTKGLMKGLLTSWSTGVIKVFKYTQSLAKGFWESKAVKYLRDGFSKLWSKLTSTITEMLGPLAEYFQMAKDMIKGAFGFLGSLAKPLLGIFKKGKSDPAEKTAEETKKGNSWLRKILSFMKGEEKREKAASLKERLSMKIPRTKGDWVALLLKILGGAVVGLGMAIGGVVRSITLPFEVLWSFLGGFKFLKKIPILGTLFKWLGVIATKVSSLLMKIPFIGKIFSFITSSLAKKGILGKLLSGILRGFKFLGWPLAIIMGLIDFIKGFTQTEGTLWDKIKGGLKAALWGFFELPITILGWMGDKVLEYLGIEMNFGEWVVGLVTGLKDKILGAFNQIKDSIYGAFAWIGTLFSLAGDGQFGKIYDEIKKKIKGFFDFIVDIIKGVIDLFMKYTPAGWIIKGVSKGIEKIGKIFGGENKVEESKGMKDLERERVKKEREEKEENKKRALDQINATNNLAKEMRERQIQPGQIAAEFLSAQGGGEGRPSSIGIQPPDELESIGLYIYNAQ